MSRPGIGPRIQRMLALIPWVRSHPEGVPIDEVCARFGVDRARLLSDIESLGNVGVEPFLPGEVLEVVVERNRLFVFAPLSFQQPLRISSTQALALVASSQAILGASGDDPDHPLRRALAKLASTLGIDTDDALRVSLGPADSVHLDELRGVIDDGRQVEIEYFTASRNDRSTRTVDPYQVVSMGGYWYLSGWCHQADGDRLFRLDRITEVRPLDTPAVARPDREPLGPLHIDDRTPRLTIDVLPEARWVLDTFVVDHAEPQDDGRVRAVVPVASEHWLHRLLLQLGSEVRVVDDPHGLADDVVDLARSVLARYR